MPRALKKIKVEQISSTKQRERRTKKTKRAAYPISLCDSNIVNESAATTAYGKDNMLFAADAIAPAHNKLNDAQNTPATPPTSNDINDYINKIIHGDSMSVMKKMPSESIDLIVTSPPYNLKNSTGNGMKDGRGGKWAGAALVNGYSHYNDNMPHDKYAEWQHNCLVEMYRLIKETGAIFYNHKWRVQDGLMQNRQDIIRDLPVRQIIIWKRKGGINFNPGYFLPTYEVIYLISKPSFKLVPKANAVGDVWEFAQEMNNDHPAPFPVALIERIISSTSANLILDPFSGSGTTAVTTLGLKRKFIGIELSPDYCKKSLERIMRSKIHPEVSSSYSATLPGFAL